MSNPQALRADARRNIDRVLDAAVVCLSRNPDATMQQIAAEAGVGRVTAYAHFSSRTALVSAALARVIDRGDAVMSGVDLDGDPVQALHRLVAAGWELSAVSSNIWAAARESLSAAQIRTLHDKPAERARALLLRGQRTGVFRTDLPAEWLIDALHALMKLALDQVLSAKIDHEQARELIARSAEGVWRAVPDDEAGKEPT